MTEAVLPYVIATLGLAMLLALARLLRGPNAVDRILALDTLYTCALCLLIALAMRWRDAAYFEAALLIGLLGFFGTVALARYASRGKAIG